jgi:DNA-binding transcriptional regulator YdaS (Cro superfamily)
MSPVQLAVRRACDDPNVKSAANLARLLTLAIGRRVSAVRVQQWLSGRRPVPAHCAPAIERITEARVRCWDLCPEDWHLLWPNLVGVADAPAVPVAANDARGLQAA